MGDVPNCLQNRTCEKFKPRTRVRGWEIAFAGQGIFPGEHAPVSSRLFVLNVRPSKHSTLAMRLLVSQSMGYESTFWLRENRKDRNTCSPNPLLGFKNKFIIVLSSSRYRHAQHELPVPSSTTEHK